MGSSESEEELLLLTLAEAITCLDPPPPSRKKKHRPWMKEWRKRRPEASFFLFLQNELKLNDKKCYKNFLRMNEDCFKKIVNYIEKDLRKQDTCMRLSIPVNEKLALILRFLATGESFTSLDYQSRISTSFISRNIDEICTAIYVNMKNDYLKFPSSTQEWMEIERKFLIKWQFPLCLGALDGRHIAFAAPKKDVAFYRNYKGFDSIVLLVLADADCRITYCDIGCNGRISDGGVLRRSSLQNIIERNNYLPEDNIIGNNRRLPYVIVGDDAFALQTHLMKPYPFKSSEIEKKIFNLRLSRARHVVEHTFGILANRFRVLQTKMNLKVEVVQKVVQACCILHNFLLRHKLNDYTGQDEELAAYIYGNAQDPTIDLTLTDCAENIRKQFSLFFTNEGSVDWQKKVL